MYELLLCIIKVELSKKGVSNNDMVINYSSWCNSSLGNFNV